MRIETLIIAAVLIISACSNRTENNKHAELSINRYDSLNIRDSVNNILKITDTDTLGITDSIGGFSKVEKSDKKESFKVIELDQGSKLVLNPNIDTADSLTNEIFNEISDFMLKLQKLVPADSVTIDLGKSINVNPIFGVSGVAFHNNKILISFYPEHPYFSVNHILQTLAHEIHHVSRFRMPDREPSLLELMILEGLADHFSVEVLNCEPPPWSQALSEEDIQKFFIQVKPLMNIKLEWGEESWKWFEHWFLGRSVLKSTQIWIEHSIPIWSAYPLEEKIPRYTGYSLGWKIVENYLKAHPKASASNLVHTPAEVIVKSTPELLY